MAKGLYSVPPKPEVSSPMNFESPPESLEQYNTLEQGSMKELQDSLELIANNLQTSYPNHHPDTSSEHHNMMAQAPPTLKSVLTNIIHTDLADCSAALAQNESLLATSLAQINATFRRAKETQEAVSTRGLHRSLRLIAFMKELVEQFPGTAGGAQVYVQVEKENIVADEEGMKEDMRVLVEERDRGVAEVVAEYEEVKRVVGGKVERLMGVLEMVGGGEVVGLNG
ncbi:hypothetical protein GQ44DRAFT_764094 [Phaeosphaeriaceae sp. PMI808]|nr:hypothetical protein GQ44DRAFT_764094 [Phaeosphaeriaceae sp. PMI808]